MNSNYLSVALGAIALAACAPATSDSGSTSAPVERRGVDYQTLDVGYQQACSIQNGQIQCWQQGYGTWTVALQNVVSIALAKLGDGINFPTNYALLGNGTVYLFSACPTCGSPVQVSGLSNITALSANIDHACALRADGIGFCWGNNASGQLGNGTVGGSSATPVQISRSNLVGISAGYDATCAVDGVGLVYCWGANTQGENGNTGGATGTPTQVGGVYSAIQVSAGRYHACVTKSDGTAWCWGWNPWGQLGNGTTQSSATPVQVSLPSSAHTISAGNGFSCAVVDAGTVYCWGANFNHDALGGLNQTQDYYTTPQWAYIGGGVDAIGLWANGGCARDGNGSVNCWGDGGGPNLVYDASNSTSWLPNGAYNPGSGLAAKIAGGYAHTCALKIGGEVKCWGLNNHGQLGTGNTNNSSLPQPLNGPGTAIDLAAGNAHTCMVVSTGQVLCWGYNYYGQLGVGDTYDRHYPTEVPGIEDAIAVTAQAFTTCVLHSNGTLSCFGYGSEGELGNGTNTFSSPTPVPVSNITGVTAISSSGSGYHTCAVRGSLSLLSCWGWNAYGQLGNGNTTNSNVPVAVAGGRLGLGNTRSLAAGAYHTCAAFTGNGVRCWGSGTDGELGNGAWNNSSTSVLVSYSTGWSDVDLTAGYHFTCARLADGTAKCWGWNYYGQIGDNGTGNTNIPITVAAPDGGPVVNIAAIGAGSEHACLIQANDTAQCWGGDFYGQLGNGSFSQQLIPGPVTNFP
jgi:alpha-tubulin suppressor-like RCC1 family protein